MYIVTVMFGYLWDWYKDSEEKRKKQIHKDTMKRIKCEIKCEKDCLQSDHVLSSTEDTLEKSKELRECVHNCILESVQKENQ